MILFLSRSSEASRPLENSQSFGRGEGLAMFPLQDFKEYLKPHYPHNSLMTNRVTCQRATFQGTTTNALSGNGRSPASTPATLSPLTL